MPKNKFIIQDSQYVFPYHHLVSFDKFKNYESMPWGAEYYAYIKYVLVLIKHLNFNSLLDVGCGDGKMIFELMKDSSNKGKKVVGIDLSEKAILFAKAFNYNNGTEFYIENIDNINMKFDLITLIETIEHIPDLNIKHFIQSINNRLNKNGIVIVTVPSVNIPLQTKHYRHYNLDILKNQFSDFTLESCFYSVKNGMIYNLINILIRKLCSFHFIRNILFRIYKNLLFSANKKNSRHLICVFRKKF